jgi:protein-tyrosine-phosphatase
MAEGLLRRRLDERHVPATVSSAGISFEGRAATDEAIAAAARYGVDITNHRSRILNAQTVRDADLVIAMERMHAREAVVLVDDLFGRCFTLKELVRRGESAGARRPGEDLAGWLGRIGEGRRPMDLIGGSPDDDVADPYLGPPRVYASCIAELDDLVDRLVDLAWPATGSQREGAA